MRYGACVCMRVRETDTETKGAENEQYHITHSSSSSSSNDIFLANDAIGADKLDRWEGEVEVNRKNKESQTNKR
jgi:hypothetical protein